MRLAFCLLLSGTLHLAFLSGFDSEIAPPTLAVSLEHNELHVLIRRRAVQEIVPKSKEVEQTPAPTLESVRKIATPKKVIREKPEKVADEPAPPMKKQGTYSSENRPRERMVERAEYLSNPPPHYPDSARRRKHEGIVLLKVQIDEKGAAIDVEIKTSSGFSVLDREALQAVNSWRFSPATRGGKPVHSSVLVPIEFRLNR